MTECFPATRMGRFFCTENFPWWLQFIIQLDRLDHPHMLSYLKTATTLTAALFAFFVVYAGALYTGKYVDVMVRKPPIQ